mgnify:CR=1 FL=1
MLVFSVCAVTAVAGRYLVQALAGDSVSRVQFVMAVLLLPVILLMVASGVRRLLLVLKSRPWR